MNTVGTNRERGYSLIEVVIALSIGLLVVTSAFLCLEGGRTALAREPRVAETNANVRSALARVSADLTVAGIGTPSEMAVLWLDGVAGGTDEITILYADAEAPIARISSGELERRDLYQGDGWSPVAANIQDFQLQYMQGFQSPFEDAPSAFPSAFDPSTWLTAVRITIASASGGDPSIRRYLSTTVSLRNRLGQATMWPTETAAVGWN